MAAGLALTYSAAAQTTNAVDTTNATGFAAFQVISQRNIFDKNRQPHSGVRPAPRVVDSFSLLGTMSYAKGTFAFFDGSTPTFRKVLEVGGKIAGFKVAAIAPDSATLVDGTNRVVLKVTSQLRRDVAGHWVPSAEPAAYSENAGASGSGPAFSDNANPPASPGNANAALERLMRLRQQQEKRAGP